MTTRREFTKALIASTAVLPFVRNAWALDSHVHGVWMGTQSASFTYSGIGIDGIIKTMTDLGLGVIDCMSEHVENYLGAPGVQLPGTGRPGPWVARDARAAAARGANAGAFGAGAASANGGTAPGSQAARASAPNQVPGATAAGPTGAPGPARGRGFGFGMNPEAREALRKWRLAADLDGFRKVGKKFRDAGLTFYSYNLSFNDSFTDEEIDKGFEMTKALGTKIITASTPASLFPRLAPFMEKHDVVVAIHNHTTGPEEFAKAMEASPKAWVNLDIGHFFASGYDPIAYMKEHHNRITNIHIKDRKKNNGAEMPFGEGDTPLAEALRFVRDQKYGFPVCIEYVGPAGPAVELKQCLDYCKNVLS